MKKTLLVLIGLVLCIPVIALAAGGGLPAVEQQVQILQQQVQALQATAANLQSQINNIQLKAGKTTVLGFLGGNNGFNSPTEWTQYTYISPANLHFTKNSDASTIYVIWNDTLVGRFFAVGDLGYCLWDLRIDAVGNDTSFVSWPIWTTSDQTIPISITATYTGLAAGDHDVQLWLNTINAGCYNNAGGWARTVTILEVP